MRITKNILTTIAHDYVSEHLTTGNDLVAAYLTGSVIKNNFLLAETTDIDIILIKDNIESESRFVKKLSLDIHLDIHTHPKSYYQPPKSVRIHPFLSHTINQCYSLYDENHFIDFTQAGVRSNFDSDNNRLARSLPLIKQARKHWLSLQIESATNILEFVSQYLEIINLVVQAFATFHSQPLSSRRFIPVLRDISEEEAFPALHIGLIGIIGGNLIDVDILKKWREEWNSYLLEISKLAECPPQLDICRLKYYESAILAPLLSEFPIDGLWTLLNIWVKAQILFPFVSSNLETHLTTLGFGNNALAQKLKGLDGYLDLIEEWFENWQYQSGSTFPIQQI